MKNIVLFDMDGTLTEPRKQISLIMIKKIKKLAKYSNIGIVTGSPINYVIEQCETLWYNNKSLSKKITLLPCNGTQRYTILDGKEYIKKNNASMIDEMGNENYQKLVRCILLIQHKLSEENKNLKLSGNFVSYRGSVLNWCPIGRDSNFEDRDIFVEIDNREKIRRKLIDRIKLLVCSKDINNIQISLGGSTSLDFYPVGWDKTYSLKYFNNHKIWFVGDRCFGEGNDRSIFEALRDSNGSFSTASIENTLEIIENITQQLKKNND